MAVSKGVRKVKTKWVIGLEKGTILKVRPGDRVERGTVLAILEKKNKISVPMVGLVSRLGKERLSEKLKGEEGKKVKKGEVMFKLPGFLGKKIFWPETGKFLGIDEFANFIFEEEKKEKDEVLSPVTARVEEVGSDKMVLSFRAIEFRGRPVVETKIWCESNLEETETLVDLDCSDEAGLVFRQSLDEVFLAKAEVMSVAGVVSMESADEVEVNLPVLFLSKKDWESLAGMMDGTKKQMLLNTRVGRLLVVV